MLHSEIRCDNCGKVEPVNGVVRGRWRAHRARLKLKALGWAVALEGGKDLCSSCTTGARMENAVMMNGET